MDTREELTDAGLSMLALVDELQNISWAYQGLLNDIKAAFEKDGRDGVAPQVRRRPRMLVISSLY